MKKSTSTYLDGKQGLSLRDENARIRVLQESIVLQVTFVV